MLRRLLIIMVVCLVVLTLQRPHETAAQSAADMLQQINLFRIQNGLPALQYNSALSTAAQNQASYMADNQVFSSHIGYGGSTPQSRANASGYGGHVTENIVGGTNLTPAQGLRWWVNSPLHYNTLITTQYTEAGTGFASDGEINYYVLVVGTSGGGPPPASSVQNAPEPLFVTPITLAEPSEDGSIVHVVQDGQALWSLAAHYDVALSDLLLYNNLKEDAFVQPGDAITIRLAEGQAPPPTPTPPTTHIVQEGQSLWSIAALYNVKIGDIYLFNNMTETSFLQPGDEIKVYLAPGELPPPTPTPVLEHVVRQGQTLWDIALTHGLSLEELLALNDMSAEELIRPGDMLTVRLQPTAVSIPATPTPEPTQAATATPQPTQTATAVSAAANQLAETAVSEQGQSARPTAQSASRQPLMLGIGLLIVGLLAFGGASILYLRGHDPYEKFNDM